MIWNQLYHPDSFCEKGTLKQLANLLNRSKIPRKVKNEFTNVQDVFGVILDAHITAAALQFFGMDSVDGTPANHTFEGDLSRATSEAKSGTSTSV